MSMIHMDTEQTRSVARQMVRTADAIYEYAQSLSSALHNLDWDGPSRDTYIDETDNVIRLFGRLSETGGLLGMRVQREVDEWVSSDLSGAERFAESGEYFFGAVFAGVFQAIQNTIHVYDAKQVFKEEWQQMTEDQKLEWLQEQHNIMAEEYGFEPTTISFEDLPDPSGKDARGVRRSTGIVIDIDNINSDDPWEIQEILFHETRHQMQHHFVDSPDELPKSIKKSQVEDWGKNFKNYTKPADDFEGYRKQPIEQDARDFADDEIGDFYREYVLN